MTDTNGKPPRRQSIGLAEAQIAKELAPRAFTIRASVKNVGQSSLPIAGLTPAALKGMSNEQLLELLASTINALRKTKTGEQVTGAEVKKVVHEAKSKSSSRPPDSGAKKRGGEETKRHDERMKSARYKLEAFIRDYSDMAEWKEVIEAIKTQLGTKHV